MKAVIFIDVQNDFIDGALGVDKDKAISNKIVKYAYINKCEHVPLIATRDTHYDDESLRGTGTNYEDTLEGKKLPVKHCIENTDGWQLYNALNSLVPADNIISKRTFGSIQNLPDKLGDIDYNLKQIYGNGITEIELCGFCASICVISNALILRATFPNLKISILKNLCGDINEESMNAALIIAKNCQIDVVDAIV